MFKVTKIFTVLTLVLSSFLNIAQARDWQISDVAVLYPLENTESTYLWLDKDELMPKSLFPKFLDNIESLKEFPK